MFLRRKSEEERVAAEAATNRAQYRHEALEFLVEELKAKYTEVQTTRKDLRQDRENLDNASVATPADPTAVTVAETAVRNAEQKLRQREEQVRLLERRAKREFPKPFAFLP